FPLLVDDVQHNDALGLAHHFRGDQILFFAITALEDFVEALLHRIPAEPADCFGGYANAELGEDIALEIRHVPLFLANFGRAAQVHDGPDYALYVTKDVLALIAAFEQRAAQAIDGLALLVHDIVVLEQVFAGGEILGFDGLLRRGDAFGDQPGLD